jgi:hypothetical protein
MRITQSDLNAMTCDAPGCDCDDAQIVISGRCHPNAGVIVRYDKQTGQLGIDCCLCNLFIANIGVAKA